MTAKRFGEILGRQLGNATFFGAGYVACAYGWIWAAAVLAATTVVALAAWGALHFPWRGETA